MDEKRHEVGDAHAEVNEAMRSRLDELTDLQRIANGDCEDYSNDEVLRLGLAEQAGPVGDEQLAEEAMERLDEYPLAVESTRVFEVVLGTGGPDDRLLIECDVTTVGESGSGADLFAYEPRRVLYRYSWTGSAERVLTGEDRRVALEFARRVVPELVE